MTRDAILVLSCSATKRQDSDLLPALTRYDGPAYRIVRQYRDCIERGAHPGLRVLILSAEHGILGSTSPLHDYDRKMDRARAAELIAAHRWRAEWMRELLLHEGRNCLVFGGALYRHVISGWLQGADFPHTTGGIGTQLGQLKRWLEEVRRDIATYDAAHKE